MRGHLTERREWLARFLALPADPLRRAVRDLAVRARAVVVAGGTRAYHEDSAALGRALLEEGLRLARAAGDLPYVCRALEFLGSCATRPGDRGACGRPTTGSAWRSPARRGRPWRGGSVRASTW